MRDWKGAQLPKSVVLEGRYTRLEPLDVARHEADLLASSLAPGAGERSAICSMNLRVTWKSLMRG